MRRRRRAPRSGSIDYGERPHPRDADALATWPTATRKLSWRGEGIVAYELGIDPGEEHPLPVTAEETAAMEAAVGRWKETKELVQALAVDDRLRKLLEKVGHVE